jgi:methylaspartate mutase sigma subunit
MLSSEASAVATGGNSLLIPPHSRVLLSSTSSDAHTWNLVFLERTVEECGHEVRSLGPCVPVDLLVSECIRLVPGLLLMSSVNGHGVMDGLRANRAVREVPGLRSVPAVIGGKLTTDGALSDDDECALREAGFDEVFRGDASDVRRLRALLTDGTAQEAAA